MKIKTQLLFICLFTILGFLSLQIPLTNLVASKAKFTLFDILAPTIGAFIGTLPAVSAILAVQVINTLFHGGFADVPSLIRPFPLLFGVYYFTRKSRTSLVIPLLAIIVFNLNPVGRQVWYYSLFWLIPIILHPLRQRMLLARSLGSTFTSHAVGGALWIWTFHLPASFWQGLIPVVISERFIFAIGISISYVVLNNVIGYLVTSKTISLPFHIEKRYLILNKS